MVIDLGKIYTIRPVSEGAKTYGVFFVQAINELDVRGKKKQPHSELMEVIGQRHKMFNYLRKEFL